MLYIKNITNNSTESINCESFTGGRQEEIIDINTTVGCIQRFTVEVSPNIFHRTKNIKKLGGNLIIISLYVYCFTYTYYHLRNYDRSSSISKLQDDRRVQ